MTTNNNNLIKAEHGRGWAYSGETWRFWRNPVSEEPVTYRGMIRYAMHTDFSDTVIIGKGMGLTDLNPRDFYNGDGSLKTDAVTAYFRAEPSHRQIQPWTARDKWLSDYAVAAFVTGVTTDVFECAKVACKICDDCFRPGEEPRKWWLCDNNVLSKMSNPWSKDY